MATTPDAFTSQATAIHERYRRTFAGRNRATRDLAVLDAIIADMRAVSIAAPSNNTALRESIDEWLRLYADERSHIARIQSGGPEALRAWRLVEWGDVTFLRYLREFAGHPRPSRDGWLLTEMADRQAAWLADLDRLVLVVKDTNLTAQRDQARQNLDLFRTEAKAIPAARVGMPAAELGRTLATLANGQFSLYRRHFAQRPRPSRRVGLLRRILGALEDIEQRMTALRDLGLTAEVHLKNLKTVQDRIAHHRGELSAIQSARAGTPADSLARALGDDANAVFAEYRTEFANKARATVDQARLGELCDRLQELATSMDELQGEHPTETNARNLTIVLESTKAYERESRAIADARKAN